MNNDLAIKITDVSKGFKLPHEKQSTLKGALINFNKRGFERQQVLKNLNIDIKKGEFLGILGRNGSGKSTLLKTISGIYDPDGGKIEINGKLTPFIELGVGFNPELSGRDNVFLNGALLGFSRSEVAKMYNDIVSFAEIERFMDQKLKNYSSGMQVRLAFSIAIQANTDILVLDEVLAVGDEAFQRKCYDYFNELKRTGKTVILVTHDMSAVQRFCTRALVISEGKVIYDGDTTSASDVYRGLNLKSTEKSIINKNKSKKITRLSENDACNIVDLKTFDKDGNEKVLFNPKEEIFINCVIKTKAEILDPELLIKFNNPGGTILSALEIGLDKKRNKFGPGNTILVSWKLPGIYNDGKYIISASIKNKRTNEMYTKHEASYEFAIYGWDMPNVLIHPDNNYSIKIEEK